MDAETLATVEADGRLVLTGSQHDTSWLPQDEGEIAVRIPHRGCLYLKPLCTIAKHLGITDAEAKQALDSLGRDESDPYSLSPICWSTFARKKGRGTPVYRIQLPPKALWALFGIDDGPLRTTKGGQCATRVLVRPRDEGLAVWTHHAWSLVREELELTDFGV